MNQFKATIKNINNDNSLKDYQVVEVNLSNGADKLYAVVTPIKLK